MQFVVSLYCVNTINVRPLFHCSVIFVLCDKLTSLPLPLMKAAAMFQAIIDCDLGDPGLRCIRVASDVM